MAYSSSTTFMCTLYRQSIRCWPKKKRSVAGAYSGVRCLFSDSSLRIDTFAKVRMFQKDHDGDHGKAHLMEKLENLSSEKDIKMASIQIKNFFITADIEDISLLNKLIKILSKQSILDSQIWPFGPNLMRLYHYLDLPEEAYSIYIDKDCSLVFNTATCCLLVSDLLYKHKDFNKVVDLYRKLNIHHPDCLTLALGALYHINTPDCLLMMKEFEERATAVNDLLTRRAALFAALLYLNQNEPSSALDVISEHIKNKDNTLTTNIKIMCLSRKGDIKMALQELQKMTKDYLVAPSYTLRAYQDTMQEVNAAVQLHGDAQDQKILSHLLSFPGIFSQQNLSVLINRRIPGTYYFGNNRNFLLKHG